MRQHLHLHICFMRFGILSRDLATFAGPKLVCRYLLTCLTENAPECYNRRAGSNERSRQKSAESDAASRFQERRGRWSAASRGIATWSLRCATRPTCHTSYPQSDRQHVPLIVSQLMEPDTHACRAPRSRGSTQGTVKWNVQGPPVSVGLPGGPTPGSTTSVHGPCVSTRDVAVP